MVIHCRLVHLTAALCFLNIIHFLGINPNGLSDAYANYQTQTVNHTKINYEYCKANPRDIMVTVIYAGALRPVIFHTGYNANDPNNDPG